MLRMNKASLVHSGCLPWSLKVNDGEDLHTLQSAQSKDLVSHAGFTALARDASTVKSLPQVVGRKEALGQRGKRRSVCVACQDGSVRGRAWYVVC